MTYCDATISAPSGCTAWTMGDPWPWHGCTHPSGHNQTGGRGNTTLHECRCGTRWDARGNTAS